MTAAFRPEGQNPIGQRDLRRPRPSHATQVETGFALPFRGGGAVERRPESLGQIGIPDGQFLQVREGRGIRRPGGLDDLDDRILWGATANSHKRTAFAGGRARREGRHDRVLPFLGVRDGRVRGHEFARHGAMGRVEGRRDRFQDPE